MDPRFRITVGSEPDFEDLVGDLYFDDQIVCVLTHEEELENPKLELYGPQDGASWTFILRDFEEALGALKQRLWDLRRNED